MVKDKRTDGQFKEVDIKNKCELKVMKTHLILRVTLNKILQFSLHKLFIILKFALIIVCKELPVKSDTCACYELVCTSARGVYNFYLVCYCSKYSVHVTKVQDNQDFQQLYI